ncbi:MULTISPECIES: PPOX class F420-dependent oxidoreductase [unclassified Pseudofrankia]|uniref:PPOX class F420-dependent oxidoreductase n=1 Tax=unclassified Pseudofrankia TaxID=2994372 RepID=UPI0008D9D356|nr:MULTISPECIES: PPOX class F420-dependent oxidoreductase [unclassified Pseudofrankia]MDT3444605.1 PPOX class F420-dependent oxidoreductase [Pseudofrankia sp. BMG5.37]OHV47439.1 pyridoxamine 5'-phosphate oxidase [Pseudofrankia sp. BMG5.36]
MIFSDAEQRFLLRQPRGHLSTIGPDGVPQVKPLGFTYNPALGTIDIAGYRMASSAKYRNVQANPRVAFVIDEVTEATMQGAHFLEIRGVAEIATLPSADPHLAAEIIRIHPRRVVAYNVDPDSPGLHTRDVTHGVTHDSAWPGRV